MRRARPLTVLLVRCSHLQRASGVDALQNYSTSCLSCLEQPALRTSPCNAPTTSTFALSGFQLAHRAYSSSHSNIVSFPLAQTGEGISECELVQWFVKEGDVVAEFDKVCEVQSDKASIEITSRYSGTVVKLYHSPGGIVKVGATLLDIDQTVTAPALDQPTTPTTAAPVNQQMPGTTPSTVPQPPPLPPTTPSPTAAPATATAPAPAPAPAMSVVSGQASVAASPAVRHLARQTGIDLALVSGSGPNGRVTKEDVQSYIEQQKYAAAASPTSPLASASAAAVAAGGAPAPPSPPSSSGASSAVKGAVTHVPIKGYRRAMVKSMTAVAAVPHFHFADEVLMDGLISLRSVLRGDPACQGVKLTFLPIIMKALSLAITRHPLVNSSLGSGESDLQLYASHNIGIAMATPQGLVVPNIKNVQAKSVLEIAAELSRLQDLGAAGKLSADDVSGGTITVSNIGAIGGLYGLPLVNPPEVAIVALGRTQLLPRYDERGNVVPRSVMHIAWGADHRVVDGASLAAFSADWRRLMEEPGRLLLHLR